MLDTNIVSALMRFPTGPLMKQVERVGAEQLYTSIVVAGELRFGAARKRSERLHQEVEAMLSRLRVIPIEPPLDATYADLRAELEQAGTPIGNADLWIAAQALQDRSVMVTDNVREFGRVPGLKVENWLRL